MFNVRTIAAVAVFGIAAALAPEAQATLIIEANGSVGPGGVITGGTVEATDATNTFASAGPLSIGGFNTNMLAITGVNDFGGNGTLMDVSALDVSAAGSGTLRLFFIETGLTEATSPVGLGASLTANLHNISVTRSIYFDPTDTGTESELLLSTTGASGAISEVPFEFDGTFALIEEIDLTATGPGATLSADDDVTVPEPMTLSLIGGGLLGFGMLRRRKRV